MDEIIEAAARALYEDYMRTLGFPAIWDLEPEHRRQEYSTAARAAIAAIMPAIGERMIAEVFSPAGTDRTLYGPRIRALANTMAAKVGKCP